MHCHAEVAVTPGYLKTHFGDFRRAARALMNSAKSRLGWDWFVIGGRWSGSHTSATLDAKTWDRFLKECEKRKLFWTGAGRTEEQQRDRTWALFREMFPEWDRKDVPPPIYRDSYAEEGCEDDVVMLSECPDLCADRLSCATLILPKDGSGDRLNRKRARVLQVEEWNGRDFVKTDFDGNVLAALRKHGVHEGVLVTVDYHW